MERLLELIAELEEEIRAISTEDELESFRIRWLGRDGIISSQFKRIKKIEPEKRREFGQKLNEMKERAQSFVDEKREFFKREKLKKKQDSYFDFGIPAQMRFGGRHPVLEMARRVVSIFSEIGFRVVEGPEIDTAFYNFEALNIPEDHPAREMHDTFYLDYENGLLLRTHTSNVQVRVLEKYGLPVKILAPGKCFRRDEIDATHFPVFHQIEGLCVGEGVSFADLKGTLEYFAKRLFGVGVRLRSSYFPFTEPSVEVDFECVFCGGKGCRVCKETGWIEVAGAGMVHPRVLEASGVNPERYTGFAFGMGLERLAMLKWQIPDIRMLFEGDWRISESFWP